MIVSTWFLRTMAEALMSSGGRLHSLVSTYNDILPQVIQEVDDLALAMMQQMNTIHATGANDSARPAGHFGTRIIAANLLTTNLMTLANSQRGIPGWNSPRV